MKYLILLLIIVSSCTPKVQQTAIVQEDQVLDSITRHFEKAGLFHGSVLVAKKGKIILNKRYPSAEEVKAGDTDHNRTFQIGSVTKQFTAAAILKLQEEGKLSLEDRISKYFPELSYGDKITIHHLLTHTSGIFNYTADTTFWLHESILPSSHEKMMARFANKPLEFEPGSRFSYSNSGYVLLGFIIEKVSGRSYEQFIRETIFRPLGMNHSGFDFNNSSNRATGYYDNGSVHAKALIVDSTASYAAGAIYSTTEDLYRWVQAMHEKKILKPESWEKAFTAFKSNYGYGLIIDKFYNTRRIWHNGGIHGFVSHLEYFPDSNFVVITLSNFMQTDLPKLSRTLVAAMMGQSYELPKQRQEIKTDIAVLDQYVGTYRLTPAFSITITRNGEKLMAQATGQQNFQVYPEKEDFFFYKVVDAQLKFNRNETGKVTSLVLYQNGMQLKGEKVQ